MRLAKPTSVKVAGNGAAASAPWVLQVRGLCRYYILILRIGGPASLCRGPAARLRLRLHCFAAAY